MSTSREHVKDSSGVMRVNWYVVVVHISKRQDDIGLYMCLKIIAYALYLPVTGSSKERVAYVYSWVLDIGDDGLGLRSGKYDLRWLGWEKWEEVEWSGWGWKLKWWKKIIPVMLGNGVKYAPIDHVTTWPWPLTFQIQNHTTWSMVSKAAERSIWEIDRNFFVNLPYNV